VISPIISQIYLAIWCESVSGCFLGQSAGGFLAGIAALGYNNPWFGSTFNQNLSIESLILYYPPDDAESFFYNSHPFYHAKFQMIEGTPETNPRRIFLLTPQQT
jgi:hypothetical protein